MSSAHVDSFVRDRVPPPGQLPRLLFELPGLQFGAQLNCASELLDRWVNQGDGARLAVLGAAPDGSPIQWSYAELQARANRIANLLVRDLGLVPGNRVLLRGANSPMLAACWFGVVKAGGIAVGTHATAACARVDRHRGQGRNHACPGRCAAGRRGHAGAAVVPDADPCAALQW